MIMKITISCNPIVYVDYYILHMMMLLKTVRRRLAVLSLSYMHKRIQMLCPSLISISLYMLISAYFYTQIFPQKPPTPHHTPRV